MTQTLTEVQGKPPVAFFKDKVKGGEDLDAKIEELEQKRLDDIAKANQETEDLAKEFEKGKEAQEVEEPEDEPEKKESKSKEVDWEKRYKDLQRQFTKVSQEKKKQEKEELAPETREQVESWMLKNPKSASLIKSIIRAELEAPTEEIEKLAEMRIEGYTAKAEAIVARKHPDYIDIRDSDEFQQWVQDTLPFQLQQVLNSPVEDKDDIESVSKTISQTISLYKLQNPKQEETKPTNKVDVMRDTVRNTRSGVKENTQDYDFSESQIASYGKKGRQGSKWLADNMEKIDEARRKGRFLYDLSGSNR